MKTYKLLISCSDLRKFHKNPLPGHTTMPLDMFGNLSFNTENYYELSIMCGIFEF